MSESEKTMTPSEIIDTLTTYNRNFPYAALEAAIANPAAIIPKLLEGLAYCVENLDTLIDDHDYMFHLYAMFLLAQFREKRAYPLLIRILSIPEPDIDILLGDTLTEDANRMLASVCDGDLEPIKSLIENKDADKFARSAGLRSLAVLVAQGVKSREEILRYFQRLFRSQLQDKNQVVWSSLVSVSTDLYPDMVYEDIKKAFAAGLIDEMYIDFEYVQEYLAMEKEVVLERLKSSNENTFIGNTIAEMENWAAFKPPKPFKMPEPLHLNTGQVVRVGAKVGRNDPCPCGSGKKYKRCCGKKK